MPRPRACSAMARTGARRKLQFQRLQYRFAAHLRDPKRNKAPAGIEPRRMKIYAELFYNNVEGFLASAFPVLRKITPDARWHAMARDFFNRHESHEPLFHRIAAEFLEYLRHERGRVAGDPPFLRELAHYEWVELALSVSDAALTPRLADPNGDLLERVPVLSPLAWPLDYAYAVHRIGPGYQPKKPEGGPTHLIVYRNRQDQVKFMEINAVTARLLYFLRQRPASGRKLLARIARALKHPQPQAVIEQGAPILAGLRARDIIVGTKRTVSFRAKRGIP